MAWRDEIEERIARMTPEERKALEERQAADQRERELQARLERTRAAFEGGGGYVVGDPAWHPFAEVYRDAPDLDTALGRASLDWETGIVPLVAMIGDRPVQVPGQQVTFRPDTGAALGVVGSRYTPIHNRDLLGVLSPMIEAGQATIESALCLYGGRLVAVTARFGDPISIVPGDEVVPYLAATARHDGVSTATVYPTSNRPECQNTIAIGLADAKRLGDDGAIRVRHVRSGPARLAEAGQIFAAMSGAFSQRAEAWRAMAKRSTNVRGYMRAVADALRPLAPKEATAEERDAAEKSNAKLLATLLENHDSAPGSDRARGTLWGAYNAVTHWTTHQRSRSPEAYYTQTVLPGEGRKADEIAYQIAVLALDGSTEYVSAPDAVGRGVDPRQIGRAILSDLLD